MTDPAEVASGRDLQTVALLRGMTDPYVPSREERFERLARLAAQLFDVPAAFVALLDERAQHLKGCVGLEIPEPMPLQDTLCRHVLVSGRRVDVPDLTLDPRFADHPLVTQAGYRCYFGHPLRVRGHVVGTFCVLDRRPRQLSAAEQAALTDFAVLAESELLHAEVTTPAADAAVLRSVTARDGLILQFVDTAICGLDPEGFVTFANPRSAELLGVPLVEVVGADFTARFHHTTVAGEPRTWDSSPIAAAIRTGSTQRVALDVLQRPGRAALEVEYAAAPLVIDSEVLGAVVTIADISDRRAVEKLKDEFVSVVSHELRTPLTSIRGSLGLLDSGKFSQLAPQGERLVRIALDNTERLVRLVNDILDLERIQAGRADLHTRTQAVGPILEAARDAVSGRAAEVGVSLEVAGSGMSALVDADADYLVRALTNLIGNAVKFSAAGQAVAIEAFSDGLEVHIAVTDSGRGIPPNRIGRIFERFEQADLSDSRDKGGTGLGLAITRGIVELHGGRIGVTSELDVGSVFTISLPLMSVADRRTAGDRSAEVVLIEDDDDLAEVLAAGLRAEGHRVASARGVDEAVELIQRTRPSLVVLDVLLADGHGSEVIRRLRADPQLQALPVVVSSAYELDAAELARLTLGPTRVIAKGKSGGNVIRSVLEVLREMSGVGR